MLNRKNIIGHRYKGGNLPSHAFTRIAPPAAPRRTAPTPLPMCCGHPFAVPHGPAAGAPGERHGPVPMTWAWAINKQSIGNAI